MIMHELFAVMLPNQYLMMFFLQGRALSRAKSRRNLDYMDVLSALEQQGISIRVASPKLVMEEVCRLVGVYVGLEICIL